MKKLVFWSALSVLNLVISYQLGGYFGTKLGESLNDLMIKK